MRALQDLRPHLLFLDIEMPGLTGLQVAEQASRKCHVVFVTAYDKYAVAAFEQGAVDYVLEPFSPARLGGTVSRLKERLSSAPADLDGLLASLRANDLAPKSHLRWIKASQGQPGSTTRAIGQGARRQCDLCAPLPPDVAARSPRLTRNAVFGKARVTTPVLKSLPASTGYPQHDKTKNLDRAGGSRSAHR
jgi:CheY-like chemotaxis protein